MLQDGLMNHYQLFNNIEGYLWLITAIALRRIVPIRAKRHHTACNIAIFGFILFALSDFLEASLTREFRLWLWLLKISCGVIFLIARIYYIGRKNIKWTDRYILFFLFCICIAIAVITTELSTS